MRTTTPEWGPASDEIWSFAPTTPNLEEVPEKNIFITPQWAAYITAFNIESESVSSRIWGRRSCGSAASKLTTVSAKPPALSTKSSLTTVRM